MCCGLTLLPLIGMLYAERLLELMSMALVSEQFISTCGHYRAGFLYLKQDINLCKETGNTITL